MTDTTKSTYDIRDVFALESDALQCPYPYFDQVRDAGGIVFLPEIESWLITRYDDIVSVSRNPELFSSANIGGPVSARRVMESVQGLMAAGELGVDPTALPERERALVMADPPDHGRQRSLVNRVFTPKRVRSLEPYMHDLCHRFIDEFPGDEADLVRDYAVRLPLTIIADFLGVPDADLGQLKRWSDGFCAAMGNDSLSPEQVKTLVARQIEFYQYFAAKVAERRATPRGDFLSDLLAAKIGDVPLSEGEILDLCIQFLTAGNETTTKLIASSIRFLLQDALLMERVRSDVSLIPGLLEESLRLEPPLLCVYRQATADAVVGEQVIKAGDSLLLVYAAGNRDACKFVEASELDLDRANASSHLAFGHGAHFCLGAPLARAEARIALEVLFERLSDIAPAVDVDLSRLGYEPSYILHGLERLPVTFTRNPVKA